MKNQNTCFKESSSGKIIKGVAPERVLKNIFPDCLVSHLKKLIFNRIFPVIIAAVIVSSCAVTPSVYAQEIQPETYSNIESVTPRWTPFADGLGFFHGRIESPRLEFWALKVDLSSPDISIVIRNGSVNSGKTALSTKVSSFVRDNDLVAGINALPFDIISQAEDQPIQNMGIVISDGVLLSPVNRYYDALVFYKTEEAPDGEKESKKKITRAAIVRQSSITSIENIENAAGGFHQILTNGEAALRTLNNEVRHPRSATGVSPNGDFVYFLVIDGRRAASSGGTERETAMLLAALGSFNGINFDGGGSSALAMRFTDGNVKVVNTPVQGIIFGQERPVAGCIGIRINK